MTNTKISVRDARREFKRRNKTMIRALNDVTFDVEHGEFLVLLGPSGCGKSTLLRAIAGLEQLDMGSIELEGRTVVDTARKVHLPAEKRKLSMMFQSYALWPHMTVAQNVAYPLRARRVEKSIITQRVDEVLEAVGIGELASQHPGQISGGQAQRVALARALVSRDEIILFDEPLSNVDAKVRDLLRIEIGRIHRESGFTAVYVTHDQEEAMTLATRICVMRNGKVQQTGTPEEVYFHPNSRYVARFMGTVNETEATFKGATDGRFCIVESPFGQIPIDLEVRDPGDLTVFSRPERWSIRHADSPATNAAVQVNGTVSRVAFLGSFQDVVVKVKDERILVRTMDRSFNVGDEVVTSIDAESLIGRFEDNEIVESSPIVVDSAPAAKVPASVAS